MDLNAGEISESVQAEWDISLHCHNLFLKSTLRYMAGSLRHTIRGLLLEDSSNLSDMKWLKDGQ